MVEFCPWACRQHGADHMLKAHLSEQQRFLCYRMDRGGLHEEICVMQFIAQAKSQIVQKFRLVLNSCTYIHKLMGKLIAEEQHYFMSVLVSSQTFFFTNERDSMKLCTKAKKPVRRFQVMSPKMSKLISNDRIW